MTYFPVIGFAPDIEPTTPGALKDCREVVPTQRGMQAAPTPNNTEFPTGTATAIAGASVMTLAGGTRSYIGTTESLLQTGASVLTDRSRAGGYSAVTSWDFAQIGDATLAATRSAPLQRSTGAAFSDISGAPNAKVVEVIGRQAIVLNTTDGTFGDSPDRWRTSALDDETNWAISTATLAASGRLVDTPGRIEAGAKLGDTIAVYKESSMYIGRFVDAPLVMDFDLVSAKVGTPSQRSLVNEETFHAFMGEEDFYIFDGGAHPVAVGSLVRKWFFDTELNTAHRDKVQGVADRKNGIVYWFYPSIQSTGALDRWIGFNHKNALERRGPIWGHGELDVRVVFEYFNTTAPTYDTLGDSYATYDVLPTIPYDASFWTTVQKFVGLVNANNKIQTWNGGGADSNMTWFDFGQDGKMTFVSRVRPRFIDDPSTGTLYRASRQTLGAGLNSANVSYALSNGKFDFEHEDRWHQFRTEFTGTMEIAGLDIEFQEGSDE